MNRDTRIGSSKEIPMRLARVLTPAAALLAVGLLSNVARAGIVGSAHDFASSIGNGQICLPCHTPHGANDAAKGTNGAGPLWNHALPAKKTGYTYTLYDASGAPESVTTDLDPNTILCMGCHDGVSFTDAYGGATGSQLINVSSRIGNGAGDLTGNHPIGSAAKYPVNAGDPTLSNASDMNDPKNFPNGMKLKPMGTDYVVGCTSCHEPHKRGGNPDMTWRNNSGSVSITQSAQGGAVTTLTVPGSALCLTCHLK
jgi:hypothetical protein